MPRLFLLLSISGLAIGSAFSTQRSSVIKQRRALHTTGRPLASTVLAVPRGGANPVAMSLSGYAEGLASAGAALATSVASGSRWTVPALWAVTAPACALAYIRQARMCCTSLSRIAVRLNYVAHNVTNVTGSWFRRRTSSASATG